MSKDRNENNEKLKWNSRHNTTESDRKRPLTWNPYNVERVSLRWEMSFMKQYLAHKRNERSKGLMRKWGKVWLMSLLHGFKNRKQKWYICIFFFFSQRGVCVKRFRSGFYGASESSKRTRQYISPFKRKKNMGRGARMKIKVSFKHSFSHSVSL